MPFTKFSVPIFYQNIDSVGMLFPVFQPIVPLPWTGDDNVIYEILARIKSPDGLDIQPDEFLGTKLPILAVDQAMLKLVPQIQCQTPGIHLSINTNPYSLCDNGYFDALHSMVIAREIDPELLVLEITEENLDYLFEVEMMNRVDTLRSLGLRVALDNFGEGGNGITRLVSGHFDIVKISRGLDFTSPRGKIITESVISMVSHLSGLGDGPITIVIEGIDTQERLKQANFIGANYAQGYAINPPTENLVNPNKLLNQICGTVSKSLHFY